MLGLLMVGVVVALVRQLVMQLVIVALVALAALVVWQPVVVVLVVPLVSQVALVVWQLALGVLVLGRLILVAGPCALLVALAGQEFVIVLMLEAMILAPVELLAALVVPALQLALVALVALVAFVGPLVGAAVPLNRSLGCLSASVFLKSPMVADLAASLPDLLPARPMP